MTSLTSMRISTVIALALLAAVASGARTGAFAEPPKSNLTAVDALPVDPVVTRHEMRIDDQVVPYVATAGTIPVINDNGEAEADIFYVSYTIDTGRESRPRPLIFAFNGGPGSSSVWLHIGTVGPKRVSVDPRAGIPEPPFRMEANSSSWLPFADVVLVDPVGTGLSRARKAEFAKKVSSVDGDVDSLGRFIRLFISRNSRWNSEIYLAGESYGTLRVGALTEYLQQRGIATSGVILISSILDMQTVSYEGETDIAYRLLLPSLTATAWYHGKLPPDLATNLEKALQEAEEYSSGDYVIGLGRGALLSQAERTRHAERLARLTGLSPAFIMEKGLRIDIDTFIGEILRDRSRLLVPHDSRMTLWKGREPLDPSNIQMRILNGVFAATLKTYLDKELNYRTDREYLLQGEGIDKWDWKVKNSFVDTTRKVAEVAKTTPYFRILMVSGLFDLVTPYRASDFMLAHMDLPAHTRATVVRKLYPSGHMVYLDPEVSRQLAEDVRIFVTDTSTRTPRKDGNAAVLWDEHRREQNQGR